jgi:saccharopine dehydrogenase-like NADP-dependent oxidoreductase
LRIVATGDAHGQRLEITNQVVIHPYRRWGISAGALDTGVPLAIAGRMLATGEITQRGAFGPELCVPVASFFHELARYDMYVESNTHTVSK